MNVCRPCFEGTGSSLISESTTRLSMRGSLATAGAKQAQIAMSAESSVEATSRGQWWKVAYMRTTTDVV